MLARIKDWELGESRLQHAVDNQELEDSFKNLYLDKDASRAASAGTSRANTSTSVASAGTDCVRLESCESLRLENDLLSISVSETFEQWFKT